MTARRAKRRWFLTEIRMSLGGVVMAIGFNWDELIDLGFWFGEISLPLVQRLISTSGHKGKSKVPSQKLLLALDGRAYEW